jgi:hypothetical protein
MGILEKTPRITIPMMQQQKERGQAALSILGKTLYSYNTRSFWLSRFIYRFAFFAAPLILFVILSSKTLNIVGMISFFPIIFSEFMHWHRNRQEESWIRKHGSEKLLVGEEGIEWQGKNKTIQMAWTEIAHAYIKDNICVLVKQGVEEEEIHFFNSKWLENSKSKGDDTSKRLLSALVEERCPILQAKSSRSDYQALSGQIFSYHTKTNFKDTWIVTPMLATLALFFYSVCIAMFHTSTFIASLGIIPLLVSLIPCLFRWQWHRNSQIETDDLGIALVEPKGVTWRVLWFTVDTYMTNSTHGILLTKDGKKYKFPLNTARKEELEAEIHRRIRTG